MNNQPKKFYIVATPIGNLEDMTFRAIRILKEVDVILCEDTRITHRLCSYYDIFTPTESYHAHSTQQKEQKIIEGIDSGKTYALVSDAGTPTISDPGVKLIDYLYKKFGTHIDIISIPGPSALITALSITGFSGNQFTFFGFIPHKKGRNKIFKEIFSSKRISIFYESPHRIMKTLELFLSEYQHYNRKICVARELTKIHEQKIIGSISEVYDFFKKNPNKVKGEFVVIINGQR